ncbi:hypothetical protein FJ875_09965 [Salmonella enterica]|nr:hypothetical protein [Salmonella enterica]EHT1530421.1 hypothetical protein [Salmonella enterica subsp. enterica serovar Enteritidis]EJR1734666.1 hypothetical protein [Salmonella enterica]
MQQRIAIVGGGVTAGMAACLLAPLGETTLIQPGVVPASGMPEIVPRQPFFTVFGKGEESEWIARIAPRLTGVSWRSGTNVRSIQLASTDDFLVYDKGRLAALLLDNAPVTRRIINEVTEISELKGFERIFDCRGARAVKNDPAYQYKNVRAAHTACRYIVASSPSENYGGVMRFWTEIAPGGKQRTFFQIPVNGERVSLGCSCSPDDLLSDAELRATIEQKGMLPEDVLFSGAVVPQPCTMQCSIAHVTPLGDASALPCPLTEYGVLKALSQIVVLSGGKPLPESTLRRSLSENVDPHLPQELFS